ncbi:hypothetical protein J3A83DRAFT_4188503 [Scleroderma citrinum]
MGNGTPQNSIVSDSDISAICHPLSSTVPSLTTKATSVSSVASNKALPHNWIPIAAQRGFPTDNRVAECTIVNIEDSDNEFNNPIFKAAQSSSKCKYTDHHEYAMMSEVNDGEYGVDHPDTDILMQVLKPPHVTTKTNIMVDKPVKKAKTSSCGQHGAKAKGSELAPLCTMLSQVSLIPSNSMGGSHMHYMNGNLPPQLLQDRKWTKPIIPALLT